MTIREILSAVAPRVSDLGAVSGTVNIDLSAATHFKLSIADNIEIDLQNVPPSPVASYLIIDVLLTVGSKTITNLPGVLDSSFAWGVDINDETMLVGSYDGTKWYWTSNLFVAPPLDAPGTFAVEAGDTENVITWVKATNATNTVIDAAADSGFTSGVRSGIYSGTGSSFTDTGLTNGTEVFYRAKSTASGYADSGYATGNGTPSSSDTGFLTWEHLGEALETYNSAQGVRKTTGAGGAWGNSTAWSNQQLKPGHTFIAITDIMGYVILCMGSTRPISEDGNIDHTSDIKVGLQYGGGAIISWVDGSGTLNDSTVDFNNGTQFKFVYGGDNSLAVSGSNDSGSTWTAITTYSLDGSGIYICAQIYGNNDQEGFSSMEIS